MTEGERFTEVYSQTEGLEPQKDGDVFDDETFERKAWIDYLLNHEP